MASAERPEIKPRPCFSGGVWDVRLKSSGSKGSPLIGTTGAPKAFKQHGHGDKAEGRRRQGRCGQRRTNLLGNAAEVQCKLEDRGDAHAGARNQRNTIVGKGSMPEGRNPTPLRGSVHESPPLHGRVRPREPLEVYMFFLSFRQLTRTFKC